MKLFNFLGNLAVLLLIIFGAKSMAPLNRSEKFRHKNSAYIILIAVQAILMLAVYAILSFTNWSENIFKIFTTTACKVNVPAGSWGTMLVIGIAPLFIGWYVILKNRNMTTDQRDSATAWLLGGFSASLFSIASWSISALGADNANPNLWYITVTAMAWTVINSLVLAFHKLALFHEGKE